MVFGATLAATFWMDVIYMDLRTFIIDNCTTCLACKRIINFQLRKEVEESQIFSRKRFGFNNIKLVLDQMEQS